MEVVATQSVKVITLKPLSHASRIVDSTQQLAMNPAKARVSIPYIFNCCSKSVFGKALRPCLPIITTSCGSGLRASHICAFHVPENILKNVFTFFENAIC